MVWFAWDLTALVVLLAVAQHAPFFLLPPIWLCAGFMNGALFVLGHEAVHALFSDRAAQPALLAQEAFALAALAALAAPSATCFCSF